MAIYRISPDKKQMKKLAETTFEAQDMMEQDVQNLLTQDGNIEAIAPGVLIVSEKFKLSHWGSRREIDLLGVDRQANLVVIELKRVKDGGHMELQAIRYASMIANLTFDELVDVYAEYKSLRKSDAEKYLLRYFDWDEPKGEFGENVKIILASADFNSELTTSVLWLNDNYNMNIHCVRMCPCQDADTTFLDIQTIIPLPEAEDYQKRRAKKNEIRRESQRDRSRYNIEVDGKSYENLPHNRMMLHLIVAALGSSKGTPEKIQELCKEAGKSGSLKSFDGELNAQQVRQSLREKSTDSRRDTRFYAESDDQLVHKGGFTYVVSSEWNSTPASETAKKLKEAFPELEIRYERVGH